MQDTLRTLVEHYSFVRCTSLFNIFASEGATFKFCGCLTCQPIAETLALFYIKSVLGWQALAYVVIKTWLDCILPACWIVDDCR